MGQLNEGCISSIAADIPICMHTFVSLIFKYFYLDSNVSGSVHVIVMYVVSLLCSFIIFLLQNKTKQKKEILPLGMMTCF